jgi:hypothetical protein
MTIGLYKICLFVIKQSYTCIGLYNIKNSPTIGGNTDFVENQVGKTSTLSGEGLPSDVELKVIDNQSGVITMEAICPVSSKYKQFLENLGSTYFCDKTKFVDSQGNFKTSIKLINSSEGIAFIDPDNRQVVAMKYDAKKGDSWSYKYNGTEKIDFKVSYKSETDDYRYVFFNIKVVKVEQIFHEPGITKIVYIGNHKFGLVGIEFYLEDGTVIKTSRV